MARLEEVEHEVFRYQKMIERGVEANHMIISVLKNKHQEETSKLWDDIFVLHQTTTKLQPKFMTYRIKTSSMKLGFIA